MGENGFEFLDLEKLLAELNMGFGNDEPKIKLIPISLEAEKIQKLVLPRRYASARPDIAKAYSLFRNEASRGIEGQEIGIIRSEKGRFGYKVNEDSFCGEPGDYESAVLRIFESIAVEARRWLKGRIYPRKALLSNSLISVYFENYREHQFFKRKDFRYRIFGKVSFRNDFSSIFSDENFMSWEFIDKMKDAGSK